MFRADSDPSENAQMYLAHIFRSGKGEQPLPLSQLAAALNVSAISVNQMCRKLQEAGLVDYVPYKGVSLTPVGERIAARILRRHRMWEVFLVEHLRMRWEEAHDTACRLEHDTPDEVIERLSVFLQHPRFNPQGEPIPTAAGEVPHTTTIPLAEMKAGQNGHCLSCTADTASSNFLATQGLRPGAPVRVLAVGPDGLLVEASGHKIAMTYSLAADVRVEPEEAL